MLITADTVLTGRELLRPGWIEISQDTVHAVGADAAPRPADHDLGAVTVVPGFVDTHLHGGGGANFSTASHAETTTAVEFHRRHGTTTLVASLVTAGPADLLRQVGELANDVRAGLLDGIHLEGPWLSAKRCGAHQPSLMRDPDPAEIDGVLDAGGGTIRMVTIAPERDGALAAIARHRRCGRGGRRRPYRGDLSADAGGDRRGRDGGYPPVQRDAPDQHPRARPGHRAARRLRG